MTTVPVKQTTRRGLLRRVRMRRDLAAMEKRRMCAADLFERGVIPAEIARQLGVSHQIVSDWRAAWRRSGRDGLRGADRTGRPPKVSHEQLVQLEAELLKGGEANGYPNELWTLQRVAEVIERMTGVAYHPARVWHLLREGLGWSWQRPARRAIERDDEAIQRWVRRRWPALKKGQGARTR
jgi:transposase